MTMKNMRLGTKIGGGFALVTLLLAGSVTLTITEVGRVNTVTERTIALRAPTVQSSLLMLNGMNHSLAALRGWIILGKDKFKDEREKAWNGEILAAMKTMKKLSEHWTNPENLERLNRIETNLEKFKKHQQEIEDIAQTVDNTPAMKILFEEAAPQAEILGVNITKIIDIEGTLKATVKRKAILGMMADVRGTTGLGLASLRAYMLSGDEKFRKKFEKMWAKNTRRFNDLTNNKDMLNPEQLTAYEAFRRAREIFDPLPPKMIKIRSGAEWNLANTWLGTKAAPTAFIIKGELDAMLSNQRKLMDDDGERARALSARLISLLWGVMVVGILLCVALGWTITRSITGPIKKAVGFAQRIANGDLTQKLDIEQQDEIGELGDALNQMSGNLHTIVTDMSANASTLAGSSEELSSTSTQMASGAEEMTTQAANVAAATEQMSSNINNMAAGAEQMSASVNTVATAIEEMSASLSEVAKNCAQASKIASEADSQSKLTNESMGRLNDSAVEIGKVLDTIVDIADQTNLLALNATIEAASAGEAGKGFAVVANEVKELAKQTAHATGEIGHQIEEMQGNTSGAVKAIEEITQVIAEMNSITQSIASAVEEQSATTNEIAHSVGGASAAANEIVKNVQESSNGATEISSNIQGVSQAARDTSSGASQTHTSAEDLARLSARLLEIVKKFKV